MKRRHEAPLERAVRKWPQQAAVFDCDTGQTLNFTELKVEADTIGSQLTNRAEQYVVLEGTNNPTNISTLYGIWSAGLIAVVLNPQLPKKTKETQLDCLPNWISKKDLSGRSHGSPQQSEYNFKKRATVLFTSGSSGPNKAVLHTAANHWFSARGSNAIIKLVAGDRWLAPLPLFHVSGMSVVWRTCRAGATILLCKDWQSALKTSNYSHVSLVGRQLSWALQDETALAKLIECKAVLLGGSAIPKNLIERAIKAGISIHTSYGSTEAASQIATTQRLTKYPGEAKILPFRRVQIIAGEIYVGGPVLFSGYLKEGGKLQTTFTPDHMFATGDLGKLDNSATLTVTGRKDNMLITGGENVYPEQIERVILNSGLPIEKAIVVGLPDPDFGIKLATLFATSNPKDFSKTKELLKSSIQSSLAPYQIPKLWIEWPQDVDLTSDIKVSRAKVKEFILSLSSQELT